MSCAGRSSILISAYTNELGLLAGVGCFLGGCQGGTIFRQLFIFDVLDHLVELFDEFGLPHGVLDLVKLNKSVREVLLPHGNTQALLPNHSIIDLIEHLRRDPLVQLLLRHLLILLEHSFEVCNLFHALVGHFTRRQDDVRVGFGFFLQALLLESEDLVLFFYVTHQLRLLEGLRDATVLALALDLICILLTAYTLLQALHLIEGFDSKCLAIVHRDLTRLVCDAPI